MAEKELLTEEELENIAGGGGPCYVWKGDRNGQQVYYFCPLDVLKNKNVRGADGSVNISNLTVRIWSPPAKKDMTVKGLASKGYNLINLDGTPFK